MLLIFIPNGVFAEEYEHVNPVPEEFYGTVTYSDGTIVNVSEITVLNQKGKIIGTYNMTIDGEYGAPEKSGRRLLVHAEYLDDILYFYVNSIKSVSGSKQFNSGEISKFDIVLPISSKPTPTITIPETPTETITEEPTPIITEIPTETPTTGVVIKNIPTQPIPTQMIPQPEDMTPKYLGFTLISVSICILFVITWYVILSKRMKRDDDKEIEMD